MKLHKCVFCEGDINPSDEIPYKNRFAHKICFNVHIKALKEQKDVQIKEKKQAEKVCNPKPSELKNKELTYGLTEEEWKEKQNYYSYMSELIKENPTAKSRVLTDHYIKKYYFTYNGMKNALEYFYTIQNNEVTSDCVGIIPYIYEEANAYFDKQKEIYNKIVSAFGDKQMPTVKQHIIAISPNQHKEKPKLIDLGDIV